MQNILLVFLGGGLGSVCRYFLGKYLNVYASFPLGTFLANILGCFLIGFFISLLQKNNQYPSEWGLLLTTGFCGGFTTFSTFALENHNLLKSGNFANFLIYSSLSFSLGILATWLGLSIFKFKIIN